MKFKCIHCYESCCSSKTVALNKADLRRIYKHHKNYEDYIRFIPELDKAQKVKGKVMVLRRENDDCIFLKNHLCTIHDYKPLSCRLYPFNPIFHEKKTGKYDIGIRFDEYCPGLTLGKEFDVLPLALQWRDERLKYHEIAENWEGSLKDFVKELIK